MPPFRFLLSPTFSDSSGCRHVKRRS